MISIPSSVSFVILQKGHRPVNKSFRVIGLDRAYEGQYVPVIMTYLIYNAILMAASCVLVPYYGMKLLVTRKYRKSLGPKLGRVSDESREALTGSPRIWVHAVSVGEVTAAAPIIASLRERMPEACIVLSTSTETGQEMARRVVTDATAIIYYPLDIPCVVKRVMDRIQPDIFVPVETELWPNFIRICKERGVRIVMVNGRISPRSFRRYRQTACFWKGILGQIDAVGAISRTDAERLQAMGMDPSRIHVMGNAKYDGLAAGAEDSLKEEMRHRLRIEPGSKVFVAASTHAGEEEIVIDVYRKLRARHDDMILIIVPRHPERGEAVRSLIQKAGISDIISMTDINGGKERSNEHVIVIDVIGELFRVYSLATVVFCGGSLVPKGGQNILEPAAWGTVVLHGPSMDDFTGERMALEEVGAGITVRNGRELADRIDTLLEDPYSLARRGGRGRDVVLNNQGASRRYAELITRSMQVKDPDDRSIPER